jgi:2-succinyl-5-enolpyruvyl-6-hydroxy-3-cyclohexene-1-carboxylate synthase
MVIYGQNTDITNKEKECIKAFFDKYNCFFAAEHMSNLFFEGTINTYVITEVITEITFTQMIPDIIITFGGNFASNIKGLLRNNRKKFRHWSVNPDDNVIDVFQGLTDIFECTSLQFFKYFTENTDKELVNDKIYYNLWKREFDRLKMPVLNFSNVFCIYEFSKRLPAESILHLSILNSVRIAQFCNLPKNVKVYSNLSAFGIDGCMSTFLGQSYASNHLSFLIIGDLSFFYDMNSIGIKHIKNNVRILLINNGGGSEFYNYFGKENDPTIDLHTSARHTKSAGGWAESIGFRYLSARDKNEYLLNLEVFINKISDKPIILEVFTEMESDAEAIHAFYDYNKNYTAKDKLFENAKGAARVILGNLGYEKLKEIRKK